MGIFVSRAKNERGRENKEGSSRIAELSSVLHRFDFVDLNVLGH